MRRWSSGGRAVRLSSCFGGMVDRVISESVSEELMLRF